MKNIALILMAVVCCSTACAADNKAELVLHYNFDSMAGRKAKDDSGRGNDGQVLGQVGRAKGAFGSALKLNGRDTFVNCPASPSLDISKAGTIMFWFKPDTARQGGLLGWAAGVDSSPKKEKAKTAKDFNRPSRPITTAKPNQRLVMSLKSGKETRGDGHHYREELVFYMSDGKSFDSPFSSSHHKAYYPPANQWLFYTVAFNGRTVDFYRDGVHVETRFQTLTPDVSNIPMLIGRCFGVGGESDYFKGLIDEVRVYNQTLSSMQIYELYMKDAAGRDKGIEHFGSIDIKAAAHPKPGIIFADLDYRSLLASLEDIKIAAALYDANDKQVAQGKIRMQPAWGRAEATVDVAHLPAGQYTLKTTVNKGKASAAKVQWPGRAKGWENVKVLNNLCWELLNVSSKDSLKKEYTFNNPRRGWIYVLSQGKDDSTIVLQGAKPDAVRAAGKGATQESMRWMEKGSQTLALSGQGSLETLVVRSVTTLAFHHYPHVGPGTGNDNDFLVKYVLAPHNTILTHDYEEEYNPGQFRQKWASELGRHVIDHSYPATHLEWNAKLKNGTARQQIWDYITPYPGLNKPEYHGLIMDEFTAGDDKMIWTKSFYPEWIETCAKILEDPKFAGHILTPFFGYNMYDYKGSTDFLRMFIAHGSPLAEEIYVDMRDTEDRAWLLINETGADVAPKFEKAIPGYTENIVKYISYLQREIWNPAVDFKVHLEMQFEHYATRPEFFGLGGIGEYSSYNCNNAEYVRWVAKLGRHYGLEGNTQRLSNDPYVAGQLSNPDFLQGTDDWTIQPAESGSMVVKSHKGYGRMQERNPYRGNTDTPFLWTKRSSQKPNVFSQELHNLKAGKLYFVRVWVGDYTQLMAGASKDEPRVINLRVEGGDVFDDWYRPKSYKDKKDTAYTYASIQLAPFGGGNPYHFRLEQRIFRAKGPAAKLVISDWKNDTEPGGPIGQELMFNFIEVHPYLPQEASAIPLAIGQ